MNNRIVVIGAGGVGSWLIPSLCLLVGPNKVVVVDGDTLEEGNLNRQLFTDADIGHNKAEALGLKYGCDFVPQFFSDGSMDHGYGDVLMVCADNNPARNAALNVSDRTACAVIIAANEVHSAEAYYYRPQWEATNCDPRQYYPQIMLDHSDNPLAANSGCTGLAQVANRQLVSANFMAASLAQHLFVLWVMEARKFDEDVIAKLPFHLRANLSRLEMRRVEDAMKETENGNSSTNSIVPAEA